MAAEKRTRRGKGHGCVFVRGKVWYARWTCAGETRTESTGIRVGDSRDGKTDRRLAEEWVEDRTEPLRLRHREDAIALLVNRMMTAEERLAEDMERLKTRMTVGEMADAFRSSPRRPDCGNDMVAFYCGVVWRFSEWIGPKTRVCDVGDSEAESYAMTLASRAASTYNKAMNALSLVWRVCGPQAGLETGRDPWKGIAKRRGDAHVRRALTRTETDAVLQTAKGEMRTLVAVMLYTGLRLGDACRFRWEDVRDGAAKVLTAKRNRKVGIPVHPRLAEIMGKPKESGFVMPGMAERYGAKQGRSNVSRSVKRLFERAGISTSVEVGDGRRMRPDATAHSLRHTFVTRAIEAGVPPHVVKEIVGHASGTMTERYTHLSDEAVLKAFAGMR